MLKTIYLNPQFIAPLFMRTVSTTGVRAIDQKWREAKGLSANPNAFGPLTNLPDYTYLDGRPTPMGSNQKKRLLWQREIATKIVTMSQELDYAKERYVRLQKEKEAERQEILESKLKPKGILLLENKKQNK